MEGAYCARPGDNTPPAPALRVRTGLSEPSPILALAPRMRAWLRRLGERANTDANTGMLRGDLPCVPRAVPERTCEGRLGSCPRPGLRLTMPLGASQAKPLARRGEDHTGAGENVREGENARARPGLNNPALPLRAYSARPGVLGSSAWLMRCGRASAGAKARVRPGEQAKAKPTASACTLPIASKLQSCSRELGSWRRASDHNPATVSRS